MAEQKKEEAIIPDISDVIQYQQGKIYEIYNEDDEKDNYIGSTILDLSEKLRRYLYTARCESDAKYYKGIFPHLREVGIDKFKIRLVENYPCKSKHELFTREQHWQNSKQPSMNKQKAILTDEERYKQKIEYAKIWNKSEKGKAMIEKYRSEQIECSCGSIVTRGNMIRHNESEKHINHLKSTGQISIDTPVIKSEPHSSAYETITCECEEKINKHNRMRHLESEKHKAKMDWIKAGKQGDIQTIKIHCDCCNMDISKKQYPKHEKSKVHNEKLKKYTIDKSKQ